MVRCYKVKGPEHSKEQSLRVSTLTLADCEDLGPEIDLKRRFAAKRFQIRPIFLPPALCCLSALLVFVSEISSKNKQMGQIWNLLILCHDMFSHFISGSQRNTDSL